MNVVFLPHLTMYKGNPYWEELAVAMQKEGVEFIPPMDPLFLQWAWLIRNRGVVKVLHLHFLQHHYEKGGHHASYIALLKYIIKLSLARILGYRIVWTVHNLYPHEQLQPKIVGTLAHLATAHLSNSLIVHCEYARKAVTKAFFRRKGVFVVDHPSYVGSYPNEVGRQEARSRLGLSSQHLVFLFLGAIRPYKGIQQLCQIFREIAGKDQVLIIAGKPSHGISEQDLSALTSGDERIIVFPHFIPDLDLQLFFNAADVAVFPYVDILSSGSVSLAMSFGCPIVAPDLGCIREMVQDTGVLYCPEKPDGLRNALLQCRSLDLETIGQQALKRSQGATWEKMAQRTVHEIYSQVD